MLIGALKLSLRYHSWKILRWSAAGRVSTSSLYLERVSRKNRGEHEQMVAWLRKSKLLMCKQ